MRGFQRLESWKQGVCQKYIKAKDELWKLKYFAMQKYNLQKIP